MGDANNDIEMPQFCRLGIAMGNAMIMSNLLRMPLPSNEEVDEEKRAIEKYIHKKRKAIDRLLLFLSNILKY